MVESNKKRKGERMKERKREKKDKEIKKRSFPASH